MLMWYVLTVVLCLNERLKNWCIDYYVVVNFAVIYLQFASKELSIDSVHLNWGNMFCFGMRNIAAVG